MSELTSEMRAIKDKMKAVWSAGDFGVIARIIEAEDTAFIHRLNIKPGSKVLDAACGTGNCSLPAAKMGAHVTGMDLVPDLIRQANERALAENLNIKFDVGDAEAMPYGDNEFDYVVSMFGVMFAPRPDVSVSELLRVCKPGGIIAMANWTPEGFVGKFFKLAASYAPPPPGLPAPVEWGNEIIVSKRFGSNVSDLKLTRCIMDMKIPMTPTETAEHYIEYFGPTKVLYNMLNSEARERFKKDFVKIWEDHNIASDGSTNVEHEYLEVVAVKK